MSYAAAIQAFAQIQALMNCICWRETVPSPWSPSLSLSLSWVPINVSQLSRALEEVYSLPVSVSISLSHTARVKTLQQNVKGRAQANIPVLRHFQCDTAKANSVFSCPCMSPRFTRLNADKRENFDSVYILYTLGDLSQFHSGPIIWFTLAILDPILKPREMRNWHVMDHDSFSLYVGPWFWLCLPSPGTSSISLANMKNLLNETKTVIWRTVTCPSQLPPRCCTLWSNIPAALQLKEPSQHCNRSSRG